MDPSNAESHPVAVILRVVRSASYRQMLAELPGLHPRGGGVVWSVD